MHKKTFTIYLLSMFGKLCWTYGITIFFADILDGNYFPLLGAITIIISSLLLTLGLKNKGIRLIWLLLFQLLVFTLISTIFINRMFFGIYSLSLLVEPALINKIEDPLIRFNFYLSIIWSIVFWITGYNLARRTLSYLTVANQFDVGVSVLFVLLFFKNLAGVSRLSLEFLILPFFGFSLMSIALSRFEEGQNEGKMKGRGDIWTSILFIGSVILIIITAIPLGPFLNRAAIMGVDVIKFITDPIKPFFTRILIFIVRLWFGRNRMINEAPLSSGGSAGQDIIDTETVFGLSRLDSIIGWIFGTFLLVSLLILLAFSFRFLGNILWKKNSHGKQSLYLLLFIKKINRFFNIIRNIIRIIIDFKIKNQRDPIILFKGLKRWGKIGGLEYSYSETPNQYGSRLSDSFPHLATEFRLILDFFNESIYGDVKSNLDNDAYKAFHRLFSAKNLKYLLYPRASVERK